MNKMLQITLAAAALTQLTAGGAEVGQWEVFETTFETTRQYANAYTDVEVNVAFEQGEKRWTMPAFWAGGGKWTVRFAPPVEGEYKYRVECSDKANSDLAGKEQTFPFRKADTLKRQ